MPILSLSLEEQQVAVVRQALLNAPIAAVVTVPIVQAIDAQMHKLGNGAGKPDAAAKEAQRVAAVPE